ncbi:unannotated protein [freshwater metagenome]|uniref:Unannotated protein n=1 Tax=freshwater metagenome TaxID=449393 RepID=A0A6J6JL09_9ZZZZ
MSLPTRSEAIPFEFDDQVVAAANVSPFGSTTTPPVVATTMFAPLDGVEILSPMIFTSDEEAVGTKLFAQRGTELVAGLQKPNTDVRSP